jgi:hypothetical protein
MNYTEALKQHLYNAMMDSMETLSNHDLIEHVLQVERRQSTRYTFEEIRTANEDAADQMVDAYTENERDTRNVSNITPEDYADSEAREEAFEAMRPVNVRRRQLLANL